MVKKLFYEDYRDEPIMPAYYYGKNNNNLPHFHNCVELMYIIDGELEATVCGNQVNLIKGDLLVIPSAEVHMFRCHESVEDVVLMIPISYISTFDKLFSEKTFSEYVLKGKITREIYDFICKIRDADTQNDSSIIRGYTYLILGTISKMLPMKEKQIRDNILNQKIIRYIEQNFTNQISVKIIAKVFAYTESRLSHFFNETFGCSFPEYIGKLRSQKAAYLLIYENNSVTEAAFKSGFESLRSFYRVFKKYYKMTPFQYKKAEFAKLNIEKIEI